MIRSVERDRCFRAGSQPRRGSSGHHALRYYGRSGRVLSLDWDRRAGVTPARQMRRAAASQEDWPGAERKGRSPLARAVVGRRQASALRQARAASADADHRPVLRLSAFRLPLLP